MKYLLFIVLYLSHHSTAFTISYSAFRRGSSGSHAPITFRRFSTAAVEDAEPPLSIRRKDASSNTTSTAEDDPFAIDFSRFDLSTALFLAALSFDSYVVPPSNSSRWEKGSKGMKVGFVSAPYARQLYQGLVEVTPVRITGLPEDEYTADRILSGKGVDACLLVAALEGSWKKDVDLLEREQYNSGVLDLSGAAHVGRSFTAWADTDERASQRSKRQRGKALPYHIPAAWGKGGQAVWPEAEPFYLYLQDPASVRLVFTVLNDSRVRQAVAIGSTHKKLTDLIPQAKLSQDQIINNLEDQLVQKLSESDLDSLDENTQIKLGASTWQGELPLTSRPRKPSKKSQILGGAAAGAYVAGPVGAAAGAFLANMYEGKVQGCVQLRLRYLPIPKVRMERKKYTIVSGSPGIDWGGLYEKYWRQQNMKSKVSDRTPLETTDLEHLFFINHDKTGATCAVYRSIERKTIAISFRGTDALIDLVTDASLLQDAWVEGCDVKEPLTAKVHAGFRSSLNSISRRLKELILAVPQAGEDLADYNILVTGHSLGGALATLFVADVAEYGMDAGRGLPQLEPSEPWWKSIASTFLGAVREKAPPRPKSLQLYNFASPRVGNKAFAEHFDSLVTDGHINQAYRIVNGDDVVARLPRSMYAFVFDVGYKHCGTTVLLSGHDDDGRSTNKTTSQLLWIEGESDDSKCPVRDMDAALTSPMAEGSLLDDLYKTTRESLLGSIAPNITDNSHPSSTTWAKLTAASARVKDRITSLTATDVASVIGLDRKFTEREFRIVQSILQGKAFQHHREAEYYAAMGRASGFLAVPDKEIVEL